MRTWTVLPPLAAAVMLSTLALATTKDELTLLRPHLGALEDLCEDALDTRRVCDAINDIGDYQREGETQQEACDDLVELVDRCERDLDQDHVSCRIFDALADDFCEDADVDEDCGRMEVDQVLRANQRETSCDGRFVFVMQGDGNLVLYQDDKPLWSSQTQGNPGARAVMQGDGNLVVYSTTNAPLWNSETFGNPGSELVVQDDGNVVIYDPDGDPLWSTGTCCL
jgi:hypothetical protein